jgi:phosphopantothenoylcysteine decarboxylase/phosphopantothenate--cysteine ligase
VAEENGSAGRATVALCISGSIAAYKAAIVARLLVKQGVTVLPVMTASATRFVGAPTLEGICGQSVALDMWSSPSGGELHVELGARALRGRPGIRGSRNAPSDVAPSGYPA